MKSLKMLMIAGLTILTISVFSQNNTTRFSQDQLAKSKKELMKMEVMKMQTSPNDFVVTGQYSKGGLVSTLSPKEQMKRNVMRLNNATQYTDVAVNKSGKCPMCVTMSNLSPKEKMKMTVMALNTCPMNAGIPGIDADKCSICGMDLSAVNYK